MTERGANEQRPPPYGSGQAENTGGGGSVPVISFNASKRLAFTILSLTLDSIHDDSIHDDNMPQHWHVWMVFLSHIISSVTSARLIETDFPWVALVEMLNKILVPQDGDNADISAKMTDTRFPSPVGCHLPEYYNLRGFDWAQSYFPQGWFNTRKDSEERKKEFPSRTNIRRERILLLATKICDNGDWLAYNNETNSFAMHPALERRLEASKAAAATTAFHRDLELDVDMTGCGYLDENGFYVVEKPEDVEWKRQLDPVVTPEAISEVARSVAAAKGTEVLHPEYTAYVIDSTLLTAYPNAFGLITGKDWLVVTNSGNITPSTRESRRSNLIYC